MRQLVDEKGQVIGLQPWPDVKAYFYNKIGSQISTSLITLKQIHSGDVHFIHQKPTEELQGDGMVTQSKDLLLAIYTADCVPILAYSPSVVGAAHAGWRGLAGNLVENFLKTLLSTGVDMKDLRFAIGPCIRDCHFEVGGDVAQKLSSNLDPLFVKDHPSPEKKFVDLDKLAFSQLLQGGALKTQIQSAQICTYCDTDFYSYRREKSFNRLISLISF